MTNEKELLQIIENIARVVRNHSVERDDEFDLMTDTITRLTQLQEEIS